MLHYLCGCSSTRDLTRIQSKDKIEDVPEAVVEPSESIVLEFSDSPIFTVTPESVTFTESPETPEPLEPDTVQESVTFTESPETSEPLEPDTVAESPETPDTVPESDTVAESSETPESLEPDTRED